MRYVFTPLVLTCFALLASSCEKGKDDIKPNTSTNSNLYGKDWYDARQPDSVGFKTYNSPGRTAPFGNNGFRFEANGTFTRYTLAATDGIIRTPSTWTTTDNVKFHIKPDNAQLREYDMVVDAVKPNSLKAQILP